MLRRLPPLLSMARRALLCPTPALLLLKKKRSTSKKKRVVSAPSPSQPSLPSASLTSAAAAAAAAAIAVPSGSTTVNKVDDEKIDVGGRVSVSGQPPGGGDTHSISSNISISSSSISNTVERLGDQVSLLSRTVQAQGEALGLLQRQLSVFETRLAEAEAAQAVIQASVVEGRRVAGDVALRQGSVEMIVGQLEERWAAAAAATTTAVTPPQDEDTNNHNDSEDNSHLSGEWVDRVKHLIEEQLAAARAATDATPSPPIMTTSDGSPSVEDEVGAPCHEITTTTDNNINNNNTAVAAEKDVILQKKLQHASLRIDALQARIDHCILEQLTAEGFLLENSNTDGNSSGVSFPESLVNMLQHSAVLPCRDAATGQLQLVSQRVRIANVPVNVGAAEVRSLCASRVGPESVVSVTVTVPHYPQAHSSSSASHKKSTASASLIGDSRAFDVVFVSAQDALKAVKTLHNTTLKASSSSSSSSSASAASSSSSVSAKLVVRPVVSADITAAWQRLVKSAQQKKKKKEDK